MNDDEQMSEGFSGTIDRLAAVEHERWSHWQEYLHKQCVPLEDGSLVIPANLVERWERQIATHYQDLTEVEKESDREQVRRYLPLVASEIGDIFRVISRSPDD